MTFYQGPSSDRPIQTIHAATVVHEHALSISAACANAAEDELVVVAISRDHAFRGVWTVARSDLAALVGDLDDGGWAVVFSPGSDIADIEARCLTMARSAFDRWTAIRRWVSARRKRAA